MNDLINRQDAIEAAKDLLKYHGQNLTEELINYFSTNAMERIPTAQTEEVIPHRNYKYLSDYWCECGWHLGKKGEVKYCSECGRKVNWDE